jgi:hypothetical protein
MGYVVGFRECFLLPGCSLDIDLSPSQPETRARQGMVASQDEPRKLELKLNRPTNYGDTG